MKFIWFKPSRSKLRVEVNGRVNEVDDEEYSHYQYCPLVWRLPFLCGSPFPVAFKIGLQFPVWSPYSSSETWVRWSSRWSWSTMTWLLSFDNVRLKCCWVPFVRYPKSLPKKVITFGVFSIFLRCLWCGGDSNSFPVVDGVTNTQLPKL